MKFIKENKNLTSLILIPIVLFLVYKVLLSFKGTTLLILTILTFFSFRINGVLIEDMSSVNSYKSNWLAWYAEKNYWSKYENQSILAYEINKNDPSYEQKIEKLKNEVIKKTSSLGRDNLINLEDRIIYTHHQYLIPTDQAIDQESYPPTFRKEWDDQKIYLNYGYKVISVDEYCDYLRQ